MEIATCNISFSINYTSTTPVTGATASYRIKGSADPYTVHPVIPVPSSGSLVTLPEIQKSGEYELVIELTASGVVTKKTSSFKIGNCSDSVCKEPTINKVEVRENGQIVMDYTVDTANLATPEYQIATDIGFKNIIHFKVDFDYSPQEYVYMDGGNIPDNTPLYIRARSHCESPSGVSGWSNVVRFSSKVWAVKKAPYTFDDVFCVSGKYRDPIDEVNLGASICWSEGPLHKTVNLTTLVPQVGTGIYLSNGITPAIPGNLAGFETGGASVGFNDQGIRWIRFSGYNEYTIYDVDPSTGIIKGIATSYSCKM